MGEGVAGRDVFNSDNTDSLGKCVVGGWRDYSKQ